MRAFISPLRAALAALGLFTAAAVATAGAPSVGSAAPEISAKGWIHSAKPVTLESLRGKVVVVEFWATWCPPCRKSIPHLVELHESRAKDGLVVVGLTDEAKETVEPFSERMKMSYIIGYGSGAGEVYGIEGIPSAFVVGRDGKVAWSGHPMNEAMAEAIDKALAEKAAGGK